MKTILTFLHNSKSLLILCLIFSVSQKTIAQEQSDADLKTLDRKSTRLNSSHVRISYAVFCLKKKIVATRQGAQKCFNPICCRAGQSSSPVAAPYLAVRSLCASWSTLTIFCSLAAAKSTCRKP